MLIPFWRLLLYHQYLAQSRFQQHPAVGARALELGVETAEHPDDPFEPLDAVAAAALKGDLGLDVIPAVAVGGIEAVK